VRHRNGKDVMLPGGIIFSVIGFFTTIIGYIIPAYEVDYTRPRSLGRYVDNTSIKNVIVFIGIILLVLGIVLLVLKYIKKNKIV